MPSTFRANDQPAPGGDTYRARTPLEMEGARYLSGG
jgi:hypothetical protein